METSVNGSKKLEPELLNKSQTLPFVSVIVPNYNGEKFIKDCLDSVYSSDYLNFEVILADDASKDNSISIIRNLFPKTKIIPNKKNLGFVRNVNKAIKESNGEIIVLLNMDTVVRRDWLSELVRALISDEKIGIVGSKILNADGKTIQYAGAIVGSNGVPVHIGRGEEDVGQYDIPKEVEYACGASVGFRKKILEEIGYLDKDYSPLYYEDTDFSFRAKRHGYKVLYIPKSVLVHDETPSTCGLTAKFYYRFHKSRIRFVIKVYGMKYFFTNFLKAEIEWLRKPQPKELRNQLIYAYLTNLFYLPRLLFSRFINILVLKGD